MTLSSCPPPAKLRRVLRGARRRLHALPLPNRPADLHAILTATEAKTLAKSGAYPLPPQALAWLAEPPAARARRRQRWRRRVEAVARSIMAADLPEALKVLLGRRAGNE